MPRQKPRKQPHANTRVGVHAVFLPLVLAAATPAVCQSPAFVEIGASRGIGSYVQAAPTGGVQAVDFDQDGDVDLFVPQGPGTPDSLYENDGSGQFVDIAASLGLDSTRGHRSAVWFDYDADGDLDVAVAGDCRFDPPTSSRACADPVNLMLFRQQADGQFADRTEAAGLDVAWGGRENQHRGGLAAGDLDRNGFPDLYVSTWNDRLYLFMNQGDGTFQETAIAAGIGAQVLRYHQPIMHDFDGDGWLDVYQPVDFGRQNRLWLNQRDGTFLDGAVAAGVNYNGTDMGVDLGDFDGDGDFDLYVTNIAQGNGENYQHNVLFRNDSVDGALAYAEISVEQGVDAGSWGWGTTFFDADNDGDLDLAATNGRQDRGDQWATDPSRFFLNAGSGPLWFTEAGGDVGFDDTLIGSGLVALDADRDGDLDLAQITMNGGLRLLENQLTAPDRHWLVVRPRSDETNHFVAGAVIKVLAGGIERIRLITAGKSTLSQEPHEAHFGLGPTTQVDRITILWPNGRVSELTDVAADQVLTVTQIKEGIFGDSFEAD